MIITCENCSKKFEINADLIPDNGRLLQCSGCNYKWFFKKETTFSEIKAPKNENPIVAETNNIEKSTIFDHDENTNKEIQVIDVSPKNNEIIKKISFLNYIVVFIISFAALILLIDTFKYPLSSIFPNIEFLLYNLYESFKDLELFFRDLK
jgi:predicted Zn finger-like uncharacterized protein